ncbi:MAG: NAD(P)-binding domain-containing protein, partial [Chloroflexi bacterium]|nr:NAD(P)-binding domain-containing protein [Chloroflexota bacterium]
MQFGIVGLGRMGSNLAHHAIEKGHRVVGYDQIPKSTDAIASVGLEPAGALDDMTARLQSPRIILLYVPHGAPTESACQTLRPLLQQGDIIADGGNSHWADSQRRHAFFAETGIRFLDVGTSG